VFSTSAAWKTKSCHTNLTFAVDKKEKKMKWMDPLWRSKNDGRNNDERKSVSAYSHTGVVWFCLFNCSFSENRLKCLKVRD